MVDILSQRVERRAADAGLSPNRINNANRWFVIGIGVRVVEIERVIAITKKASLRFAYDGTYY